MPLTILKVPPGISSGAVKNIPDKWDAAWFRRFITNFLQGGDVRNATAGTGITIAGNLASPFATISATGGSGGGVPTATAPSKISDLMIWVDASLLAMPAAATVLALPSPDPYRFNWAATADAGLSSSAAVGATLNSLPTLQLVGNSNGNFATSDNFIPVSGTLFAVVNPTSGDLCSGKLVTNAINFEYSSANHNWGLARDSVAAVGSSSVNSAPAGTWKQFNCVWTPTTWAFRVSQTADTSGAGTGTVTNATNALFYQGSTIGTNDFNGVIAELIMYARALTLTEIQSVEAYLHTKWGV